MRQTSAGSDFALESMPQLEAGSFVPLYAQLAEIFAGRILGAPETLAGATVPSESRCMAYFNVSRPTVRHAMAQLTSRGLISRGRGRGTFVAPQARLTHDLSRAFELQQAERFARFEVIARESIAAPAAVSAALQLESCAPVEKIVRVRLIENAPFGYEERFIPARFSAGISEESLTRLPIVSLIRAYAGEPPTRSSFTVRSLAATKAVATTLNVKARAPMLSSEHWYALANGERILYGTVLFFGDRYQFTVETDILSN